MQGVIKLIALVAVLQVAYAAIEDNYPKQKIGPDGYIFEVPEIPFTTPKKVPSCGSNEKLVGGKCVAVTKPPVVATTTKPGSTYLPPVTCPPGLVSGRSGKCECSAPFVLSGGSCVCPGSLKLVKGKCECDTGFVRKGDNCEKVTLPPTRATVPPTKAVPRCLPTQKLVGGSCVDPPKPPPPVVIDEGYCPSGLIQKGKECMCPVAGQVNQGGICVCPGSLKLINLKCDCDTGYIRNGDNCEKPAPPTTRATVPPTKPAPRCLPTQKLVGGSCVDPPKPAPTTVKPTTVKVTTRSTPPPSTYLPPVTCPPGLVQDRSGKCGCSSGFLLVNGKCEKPTPPPTKPTTRATPPPTKPVPRCLGDQKLVGGSCVDVPKPTTVKPTTSPPFIIDEGYCPAGLVQKGKECVCPTPGQVRKGNDCVCSGSLKLINFKCDCDTGFIRKGDNCEKPASPTTRATVPPTKPAPRCLPTQKLVGGSCVDPPKPPPTTVKPTTVKVTTRSTPPPSTYLPPVTCPPGLVQDRSGKCGCSSGFLLVNGKCEKPTPPPTKPTTRATPPPSKPAPRCLGTQKLVGGSCVEVTTPKPIVVTEGYCPSGLIQKPDGTCVCPPGLVQKGETCVCEGQLQLVSGKCQCASGLLQKGTNCEKPAPKCLGTQKLVGGSCVDVTTPKPTTVKVTTRSTPPPSTYLPPVTCPPGLVQDRSGKCGCSSGFLLVNGKCEKPTPPPTKPTTRATPPPSKPAPRCLGTQKLVGGSCVEVTTPKPIVVTEGYCPSGLIQKPDGTCVCPPGLVQKGESCVCEGQLQLVSGKCQCASGLLQKGTNCEKPAPKCLGTQKLVGGSCVDVTTPKPTTVKVTTRSTPPPSTYLPPVTCPPGLVQDRSGKCGCSSGFLLVNGKCEKPTPPPTKPTTRATPPPSKPAPRCLGTQKLVGGSCVEVTTPKPIVVTEGYCPSGLIQKPDGTCVCPPGLVQKGESCVCEGQLQLVSGKCQCASGLLQKGTNCEKPAPKCLGTQKLVGGSCVDVTTPKPTTVKVTTRSTPPPSTYLPPVTCAPGLVLDKSGKCGCSSGFLLVNGKCEKPTPPPTKPTTRATPPPTKPAPRCLPTQKLVGGSCVDPPKPPPTTVKPTTVKVTTRSTPPPSTYLPPVTCPPGLVQDRSGNCGCSSGFLLVNGKCEKPIPPPTKPTTRATPPPTKPAPRCLGTQKLVGGACVEVTTPKPIVVTQGYCPSGLIQKPDGTCVCPPGLVQKGESCVCEGQLQLVSGKCRCASGLVQKGTNCEKPAPKCVGTQKLVGGSCVDVTTPKPATAPPSTYLPPVTCAPGLVFDKSGKCGCSSGFLLVNGKCEKPTPPPTKPTTRATPPPTKPAPRCLPTQKLVGGSCVDPPKPPPTTVKPTTVKVTTRSTPPPSTYLPPVTCPPGLVQDRSGNCGCSSGFLLVNGKCEKPTPPPTKPTTRATPPPSKPAPRCLGTQKLVGGACVEVTTPKPIVVTQGYCPSGLIQKPDGTCVCPLGLVQKGESCVCEGQLQLVSGKCQCASGLLKTGNNCEKPPPPTVKTTPAPVTTKGTTTKPPVTYLPPPGKPVPKKKDDDFEAPPYLPPSTTTTVRTTPKPKAPLPPKPKLPDPKPVAPVTKPRPLTPVVDVTLKPAGPIVRPPPPRPPLPPPAPRPVTTPKPVLPPNNYVYEVPSVAF